MTNNKFIASNQNNGYFGYSISVAGKSSSDCSPACTFAKALDLQGMTMSRSPAMTCRRATMGAT